MDREDLRKAMQQAQEMQISLVKAQAEFAHTEIQGNSHDGRVKVLMTAQGDFHSIRIDPYVLAEGVTAIEAGVLEDATTQAATLTKERLQAISKSIGL
jgi:nucleoid-associated protein EbfC